MPRKYNTARVTKTCLHCGKSFTVKASDAENRPCRFCSVGCARAYQRAQHQVERVCVVCGKTFTVQSYQLSDRPRKYCSLGCRNARGRANQVERFWERVAVAGPDECWLWTGARQPEGYGKCHWDGRQDKAHRVSYLLANGPIPDGGIVCHSCDNPSCVNPAHLFLGTPSSNTKDCWDKNRHPRRVTAPVEPAPIPPEPPSLSPNQEAEIRARVWQQIRALASEYGVSRLQVYCTVTGATPATELIPDDALRNAAETTENRCVPTESSHGQGSPSFV